MLSARQPSEAERLELKRLTRQAVGRVSQRAQMMLLSTPRHPVPALAPLFAMSRATMRCWSRRFNAHGPAGLSDDPRRGRPRKGGSSPLAAMVTILEDDPRHAGSLATFWTVALLGMVLVHQLGVRLSTSTLRGALHRLGLRWGRPRLAMPLKVDPHKAGKQWVIAKAVVEASPEAAILYADESRLQLLPLMRAMWHWVGQPLRIPTPGTKVTRALFSALNIRTGRWVYRVRARRRPEDGLAFLEHLLIAYPQGPILLMVDNFSSHTAHAVGTGLAVHPRLPLYDLPKYGAHLNPVEPIWRQLKNTLAANRL
jgi:transposase